MTTKPTCPTVLVSTRCGWRTAQMAAERTLEELFAVVRAGIVFETYDDEKSVLAALDEIAEKQSVIGHHDHWTQRCWCPDCLALRARCKGKV